MAKKKAKRTKPRSSTSTPESIWGLTAKKKAKTPKLKKIPRGARQRHRIPKLYREVKALSGQDLLEHHRSAVVAEVMSNIHRAVTGGETVTSAQLTRNRLLETELLIRLGDR